MAGLAAEAGGGGAARVRGACIGVLVGAYRNIEAAWRRNPEIVNSSVGGLAA